MRGKTHLYVAILVCLGLIFGILKVANAQDINSLEPNSSITTESPDVVIIKTPTKQQAETPSTDIVIIPQTPYLDYNNLSPEFVRNLKAGQLANFIKINKLAKDVELRMFASRRSAQEDLALYSLSITLHQRAIKEGIDINYYLDQVKAGKISLARLKKDVDSCGTGFLLYPDTNPNKCSKSSSWLEAERAHDAAGDTIDILKIQIDRLQGAYYLLEAHYKAAKDSITAWFNEAQFWKSKAKKGKK